MPCIKQTRQRTRHSPVRSVASYLEKAEEFDALAAAAPNALLQKRYADIAECYRLLAAERKRQIETGSLESE